MTWVAHLLCLAIFLQTVEMLKALRDAPITPPFNAPLLRGVLWIQLFGVFLSYVPNVNPLGASLLVLTTYAISVFWNGSFNGGSDGMTFHLALAWAVSLWLPQWEGACLMYVMALTTTSYFIAGFSKLLAGGWTDGSSMTRLLTSSPSIHPGYLRNLLLHLPRTRTLSSLLVILFELSFPLVLIKPELRPIYLAAGLAFHLANYFLFGLNRFVWIWMASYPAFFMT